MLSYQLEVNRSEHFTLEIKGSKGEKQLHRVQQDTDLLEPETVSTFVVTAQNSGRVPELSNTSGIEEWK